MTSAKITDGTIVAADLATGSVTTVEILDATIATADLAATSVTKEKINADVAGLGLGKNADGSLESNVDNVTIEITTDALNLKDAAVTDAKLAVNAVTTTKILDAAVTSAKILD